MTPSHLRRPRTLHIHGLRVVCLGREYDVYTDAPNQIDMLWRGSFHRKMELGAKSPIWTVDGHMGCFYRLKDAVKYIADRSGHITLSPTML